MKCVTSYEHCRQTQHFLIIGRWMCVNSYEHRWQTWHFPITERWSANLYEHLGSSTDACPPPPPPPNHQSSLVKCMNFTNIYVHVPTPAHLDRKLRQSMNDDKLNRKQSHNSTNWKHEQAPKPKSVLQTTFVILYHCLGKKSLCSFCNTWLRKKRCCDGLSVIQTPQTQQQKTDSYKQKWTISMTACYKSALPSWMHIYKAAELCLHKYSLVKSVFAVWLSFCVNRPAHSTLSQTSFLCSTGSKMHVIYFYFYKACTKSIPVISKCFWVFKDK